MHFKGKDFCVKSGGGPSGGGGGGLSPGSVLLIM